MLVPQHFKGRSCPTAWLPHGLQFKNISLKSLDLRFLLQGLGLGLGLGSWTVSYTHLTLPTKLEV